MNAMRRAMARREQTCERYIPYTAHVSPRVLRTRHREYVQTFRLGGASFQTADDEQLNGWHERLNVLWRNIARENIAIWTHIVRRRERPNPAADANHTFADRLSSRYRERLSRETLMVNDLYVSIVYRVAAGNAESLLSRYLAQRSPKEQRLELKDSLEVCEKLGQTVASSLARYEPRQLGLYEFRGRPYSELLEFLGLLINGEAERVPAPRGPISALLATARPLFGFESMEYRMPNQSRMAAMLGIVEYSSPTSVGMLNGLLSTPFPWILTQSFTFLRRSAAQGLLQRQFNRMQNAADYAVSQAEELRDALDELTSNEWAMGDHHLTLQVQSDLVAAHDDDARIHQMKVLNERVAAARTLLADSTGMTIAREDLALEGAFWAQLPGNFAFRPRRAPITSRNFAALAGFHNYPTGRPTQNHWGDALTMLVTSAGTPYYFSYHASDPLDPDGGFRKDTGHTLVIGPTGSGKTAFIAFTLCELQRFGVTSVLFTKDRDTEICIRALGGRYYPIRIGIPTEWNPFQLPPSPANVQFLTELVRKLVTRADGALTVAEENDLSEAVRAVMTLARPHRRLGRVLDFLDNTKSEGVFVRLKQWCHAWRLGHEDGPYAWVFDNKHDTLIDSLDGHVTTGFDTTEFLNRPQLRTPINMYLFHLIDQLVDGRRFALFVAEFWKALDDPYFSAFCKDKLKTIRKMNGFVVLDSQSPSDAIKHPHSRTLIEQTPTKICFPNTDATFEDYATDQGLNLSEREYRLIKQEIPTGSRMFLVKQGHNSVVAKLDLTGFEAELAVLSARKQNIERMEQLIETVGHDQQQWLAPFLEEFTPDDAPRAANPVLAVNPRR